MPLPNSTKYLLVIVIFLAFYCLLIPAIAIAQTGEGSYKLVQSIREQLANDVELDSEPDLLWLDLRRFYSQRQFQPVWYNDEGLNSVAQQWLLTIKRAQTQGLDPADYNLVYFDRHGKDELASQRLWVELLLTKALMHYIEDMQVGRLTPQDMGLDWHIDKPTIDTVACLQRILNSDDFETALQSLQPPHAGYQRLQAALLRYLKIEQADTWPVVPDGPVLQLGDSHENVAKLRQRLKAEGDLEIGPVENPLLFDDAVKNAVEHFQVRYGIEVDGIVGPDTRAVMNVPLSERIQQLKLNLERWRWLPRELGERYLLVNPAGYELAVYEHDKPKYVIRIIAGMPERPTPTVAGVMDAIIFNPYWYIPKSIALKDVIPRQQRNPNFFSAMGIHVFENGNSHLNEIPPSQINWQSVDDSHYHYQLRQDPGPNNSLGRIKFKFSNDFSLYLHDTPKQRLFEREARAFSSGCIRVENAIDLAEYLLRNSSGWTKQRIREVIDSGDTISVNLPQSVPVYLVYWTAWVSNDNHVYFRKDVYGWDRLQAECD